MQTFLPDLGVRVDLVDASGRFLAALAGGADPEEKRKTIGREFVEVFQHEAKKFPKSEVARARHDLSRCDRFRRRQDQEGAHHQVASHVGGLPETLHLKLLEPLRDSLQGRSAGAGSRPGTPARDGVPPSLPGPARVRILGVAKREYAELLRRADAIFIEELRAAGWYDKIAQLLRVSPGEVGGLDGRRTDLRVRRRTARRADVDFMTAHWAPLPYDLLAKVSTASSTKCGHQSRGLRRSRASRRRRSSGSRADGRRFRRSEEARVAAPRVRAAERGECPSERSVVARGKVVGPATRAYLGQQGSQRPRRNPGAGEPRQALGQLPPRKDARSTLRSALPMCAGAIMHARIARLVYGAPDPNRVGLRQRSHLFFGEKLNHHTTVTGGSSPRTKRGGLLSEFFTARRSAEN